MRAFIAIELPEELKNKIAQLQEDLKKCDLQFSWVKPDNLHLTLKFLGNTEENQLDQIKNIMDEVVTKISSFQTNFAQFGFFPNERRPRVFFISTANEDRLKSIAEQLEKELQNLGFPIEGRFKSHLTLARIKSPKNIGLLSEKIKNLRLEETFPVKEIILCKSTLTPFGPIYEKIAKSSLVA